MKGVKVFELLTLSISVSIILLNSYYSSKHKQKHLEEKEVSDHWAELDRNLLGEIASRLCVIDRARFGAVCTQWLAAAHIIKTRFSSSLPWHGCQYPGTPEFRIYDPLSYPSHLVSRHFIDWSELGDPQWTSRRFNKPPAFRPGNLIAHILAGILYIPSPFGQVASYNIRNGEFKFDRLRRDEFVFENSYRRTVQSFELNGELLIIGLNPDVRKDATLPGQQFVRRYDRSRKVWLPVRTLWGYALFHTEKCIDVAVVNTKNKTCNRLLPNNVYRFCSGGCLVYSLLDGELVQTKCVNSNFLGDGGNDLPEYKYNYSTPDTDLAYWLEAPRIRSS
ncbi:hypothetical protein ACET3Z_015385 [Daucus carota]